MINNDWQPLFQAEAEKGYFAKLMAFVDSQRQVERVFPPDNEVFNAFQVTPLSKVKVVILGQDPYHGAGQAHGLSFSVPDGVKFPPSLRNIFKELSLENAEYQIPFTGNLTSWAEQGVLLMNTVLTVNEGAPHSHAKKGWEALTDRVISHLSETQQNVVFLLWGKHAIEKKKLVDEHRHKVLTAAHPSPLSAHRGFFGCGHFSLANDYLRSHGKTVIQW